MIHETDIYQMNCADSSAVEILFDRIEKQVGELALLFGISHLPDGYKIQIDILDQNAFDQRKSLHFGKSAGSTIVAFSTVSICVVSYHAIHDRYTPEEYRQVILHELVHVLQQISTRVPPEQNAWLYEAVACYVAGQYADISNKEKSHVPWHIFKKNFYMVPECYSIAYHLGAALLSDCASGEAVSRCSDVSLCELICSRVYDGLFK